MLHVYHGDGKGKTTAAMGLAIRSAGCVNLVCIVQFLKASPSGEIEIMSRIPEITVYRNEIDLGFTFQMTKEELQQETTMHNMNLLSAIEKINAKECDLLVLDELCAAYELGLVDKNMVHTLIGMQQEELEVVITGRNPDPYFLKQTDYITEMKREKHPFDQGAPARRGVEF